MFINNAMGIIYKILGTFFHLGIDKNPNYAWIKKSLSNSWKNITVDDVLALYI